MARTRNERMNRNNRSSRSDSNKDVNDLSKRNKNFVNHLNRFKNRPAIAVLISVMIVFAIYFVVMEAGLFNHVGMSKNSAEDSSLPTNVGDFKRVTITPTYVNGKVPVLFIGSEACPYCMAESWSVYSALKNLGGIWSGVEFNFSNLTSDFPNTPGLTFANATLSDSSVAFYEYEISNRNWQPYQTLNSTNDALFNKYDPTNDIPFIMIGGVYVHVGDSYSPATLTNISPYVIMNYLKNNISNSVTNEIHNESNVITEVIKTIQNWNVGKISLSNQTHLLELPWNTDSLFYFERALMPLTKD